MISKIKILEEINKQINYFKKYKVNNYNSGWSSIESGPCCDQCKMFNPKDPLQSLIRCTNPFQIEEHCQ